MATNIPPHNLSEIVDATIMVIENPEVTIEELMVRVQGPDFPTGAFILGKEGIKDAYINGRGLITLRARAEIREDKSGREEIIISELPYQVNKARLVESISSLVREKKVEGVADLRDESDRSGMRIVIEVRRDESAQVILNQLYKHTQMQTRFGVIMLALVDNQPQVLKLKQMIYYYLEHRKHMVARRTQFELAKAESRAHILEGLRVALANLDRVISLIRESPSPDVAQKALIKALLLTPEQAGAILDMKLQRLTGLERGKIAREHERLLAEIVELKAILASPQKVLEIIKEELLVLKARYGDRRRTQILEMALEEFRAEDLIPEEDVVITASNAGYIKRIPVSAYRMQKRGGKGLIGMSTKKEDFVEHIFATTTHHYILCFTNEGKVYWLKAYQIPQARPHGRGKAIVNLLPLGQDESVTTLIPVREFDDRHFLVMATKNGFIKKTSLKEYSRPRSGGIIALNLDVDDELIRAGLTDGDKEILLATSRGHAIRFKESQVRSMGRTAKGVRGITLAEGDWVIGMGVVGGKKDAVLVITANGYGKRTLLSKYRVQLRGGKGLINIKTTQRNGPAVGIRVVNKADGMMVITSGGKVIRSPVKGIRCMGRNTKGVRLMMLSEGDRVVAVACVPGQGISERGSASGKT
jgi:DNA gyrase subunit A